MTITVEEFEGDWSVHTGPLYERAFRSKEPALRCAQTLLTRAAVKAGKEAGRRWRSAQ